MKKLHVITTLILCLYVGNVYSEQSIWVNFGSVETGNWNSIVDESSLSVSGPTGTLSSVIDSTGSSLSGVSIEVYSSVGITALSSKISADSFTSDWLTATASQSSMYLNALSSQLEITIKGLSAGTYSLDLYAFTDVSAYQHDSIAITAGIVGSEMPTALQFDTSTFDAAGTGADSQDKLAQWATIALSEGQNLSILINGGVTGTENPLINAFQISSVPEPASASLLIGIGALALSTLCRRP